MSVAEPKKRLGFLPADAAVPESVQTDRLIVRPLRASDVEKDYDALMLSAPELRCWSESDWPAADFTLAENLVDLERHEREHLERRAFTYTVLDPSERRVAGCVYIVPVWDRAAELCDGWAHAACVGFWVRTSELAGDLDRHLLATLLRWLRSEWPLDGVLFTNAASEERQAIVLTEAGLERRPLSWSDGRTGWAFPATLRLLAASG